MPFDALEVAIQLVAALRQPLGRMKKRDANLADQADRAADGIALQLSEGRKRVGKDRLNRYRMAAGSADELQTALKLALAKEHLAPTELAAALALLDRVLAMCWRLCH